MGSTKDEKNIKIKKGIWRTYDATDGLPGEPYHLLQDRQGYLWVGTSTGLCRYDGAEFTTCTADALAGRWIHALCEDPQGRLWFKGAGISCFDGDQFASNIVTEKLAGKYAKPLCIDNQGKLWIGTLGHGIFCFDDTELTNYTTDDGLPDDQVFALCAAKQGGIWAVTDQGFSFFDGHQFANYYDIDVDDWSTICEDSHGRLWIGSGYKAKGIYCFDGQELTTYNVGDELWGEVLPHNIMSIYEDGQGRLWFGGWGGVACFDGSSFTKYSSSDGLWATPVFDIMEDREGQMWFAHGQYVGLSCFDERTMQLLTEESVTWAVTQDRDGRIWFIGNGLYGIHFDIESSQVQQRELPPLSRLGSIRILVDSKDRLWISAFQEGLYCYDSAEAAWKKAGGEAIPEPRFFSRSVTQSNENNMAVLLEEEDGTIWFRWPIMDGDEVSGCSICRYDVNQFMDGEALESIRATHFPRRFIKDGQGRYWMGGPRNGGLSCWDGKELVTYTKAGTYVETFDDGDFDGWEALDPAAWEVVDEMVTVRFAQISRGTGLLFGEDNWRNYTLECDARIVKSINSLPATSIGLRMLYRNLSDFNYIWCLPSVAWGTTLIWAWHTTDVHGGSKQSAQKPFKQEANRWYRLKGVAYEDSFEFYIDGELMASYTDDRSPTGRPMLQANGCLANFDNVVITGDDVPDNNVEAAVSVSGKLANTWGQLRRQ